MQGDGMLRGGHFVLPGLGIMLLPGHGSLLFMSTPKLAHGTCKVERSTTGSLARLGSGLWLNPEDLAAVFGTQQLAIERLGREVAHVANRKKKRPRCIGKSEVEKSWRKIVTIEDVVATPSQNECGDYVLDY
jgi:hypothetical protein